MILVTGYENMDLDGAACAYAYAEFLNLKGNKVVAGVFGKLHKEADFVWKQFKIKPLASAGKIKYNKVILVDASEARWINSSIKPEQVIEAIDHRQVNQVSCFVNARIKIELVGAAATLVAEKIYQSGMGISIESAALLYSAIISNTVNFKAKTTTQKDIEMAGWLEGKFTMPKDYVYQMFKYKSEFDKSIKEEMLEFLGIHLDVGAKVGIAQWEIVEANKFLRENIDEIKKCLEQIKNEKGLDYIFLTCIDIIKGFNRLVVADDKSKQLVEEILKVEFKGDLAKRDETIMRKEIWPLVKRYLE